MCQESGASQEGSTGHDGKVDAPARETGAGLSTPGWKRRQARASMGERLLGAWRLAADARGSHPDDPLVRVPDVDPPRMAGALMGVRRCMAADRLARQWGLWRRLVEAEQVAHHHHHGGARAFPHQGGGR